MNVVQKYLCIKLIMIIKTNFKKKIIRYIDQCSNFYHTK